MASIKKVTNPVSQALNSAAATFQERDAEYGSAYLKGGDIMRAFFPNGVTLDDESDFLRYQIFGFMVAKMNRYAENMTQGGHKDSSHDLINYAAMLDSVTDDA